MTLTDIFIRHYTAYILSGKQSNFLKHSFIGEGAYRLCFTFGDKVYKFECVEYEESCNEIDKDKFERNTNIFPRVYDFREFFVKDDILNDLYKIHVLVVEKILGDVYKFSSDSWTKYQIIIENECASSRMPVPTDLHGNTVITKDGKVKILDAAGNR